MGHEREYPRTKEELEAQAKAFSYDPDREIKQLKADVKHWQDVADQCDLRACKEKGARHKSESKSCDLMEKMLKDLIEVASNTHCCGDCEEQCVNCLTRKCITNIETFLSEVEDGCSS